MRKSQVRSQIPEKLVKFWKRDYLDEVFERHSIMMIHSCGLPLLVKKSYRSIKEIITRKLSRYKIYVEIRTYTKKEGWDNLGFILRKKHCSFTRDNLPHTELLEESR